MPKTDFRAPLWARGAVAPDFFVKIDEGYLSGAARCRAAESVLEMREKLVFVSGVANFCASGEFFAPLPTGDSFSCVTKCNILKWQ
jgi:hypothetical protein